MTQLPKCAHCNTRSVQVRQSAKRNRVYVGKFCAVCTTNQKSRRQLKYGHKRHAEARAKGFCGKCWDNPAIPGLVYCEACQEKDSIKAKEYNSRNRQIVFDHYGRACKCCGEATPEFLTIDHIGGWGKDHRMPSGRKYNGASLYRWLIQNNFPSGFRTLCFNCNCSQAHSGYCPHELERAASETQIAIPVI